MVARLTRAPLGTPLGTYVPNGWGASWRAAAATGKASAAVIGDSVGLGLTASDIDTKSWWGLIATDLQARYGDGGSGYCGIGRSTLIVPAGMLSAADSWAFSAGWLLNAGGSRLEGPGAASAISTGASGADQVATSPVIRGSVLTIYWARFAGAGTFTPAIDGVAQAPIATAGANAIVKTTYNVAPGNHIVTVTVPAGQPAVVIWGVSAENPAGAVVNNFSRSGGVSSDFAYAGAPAFGSAVGWSGGVAYPASLVFYELGGNDAHASVAPDTYIGNAANVLRVLRDNFSFANGQLDLAIVTPHIGENDAAPNVGSFWPAYMARLRGLAEYFGAALIDMGSILHASWGWAMALNYFGDGTSSGLPGANSAHPSDAGHQLIHDAIRAALPQLVA